MTDDMTIAIDSETYVLRPGDGVVKVGRRTGGEVAWLDEVDPATLPDGARRALESGDTGDQALTTALRGIVEAEVKRGG
ncbi:hypothetical protein [Blastococcus sp. SYSU D00695]